MAYRRRLVGCIRRCRDVLTGTRDHSHTVLRLRNSARILPLAFELTGRYADQYRAVLAQDLPPQRWIFPFGAHGGRRNQNHIEEEQ